MLFLLSGQWTTTSRGRRFRVCMDQKLSRFLVEHELLCKVLLNTVYYCRSCRKKSFLTFQFQSHCSRCLFIRTNSMERVKVILLLLFFLCGNKRRTQSHKYYHPTLSLSQTTNFSIYDSAFSTLFSFPFSFF